MYWTLVFVFAALVLAFGFAGWKWSKAPLWKAVDIAYYLLGGIGVILLAASTQRDAALADINYSISKADAALARAQAVRSLTADEITDVDRKTRSISSGVVRVISKSACTDLMPEDAGPRRNAPTACGLRDGLKSSVERILGMKNDSDQSSPVIASDGAMRCRAVIEIQKEFAATERIADLNRITGLVLSYPPELFQTADDCERYPAAVEARRALAAGTLKALQAKLQSESQLTNDPFLAAVRYSLWPYFILVGLGLKFGKAITVLR